MTSIQLMQVPDLCIVGVKTQRFRVSEASWKCGEVRGIGYTLSGSHRLKPLNSASENVRCPRASALYSIRGDGRSQMQRCACDGQRRHRSEFLEPWILVDCAYAGVGFE
jgi:hypothetical protein